MTVQSDILAPALFKAGVGDANSPHTDAEIADALKRYNKMVAALRGSLIGTKTVTERVTASFSAFPGALYLYAGASGITGTLPTDVRRGGRVAFSAVGAGAITVLATPYKIAGAASESLSGASHTWMFDGAGNWIREEDAVLTDDVVFDATIHEALTDKLTLKLAQEYGLPVTDEMKKADEKADLRIAGEYR